MSEESRISTVPVQPGPAKMPPGAVPAPPVPVPGVPTDTLQLQQLVDEIAAFQRERPGIPVDTMLDTLGITNPSMREAVKAKLQRAETMAGVVR